MQVAKGKSGYISALKAELDDGPFCCPECRLEVILKKGDIYTHHFAHNPGEGCSLGDVDYDNQEEQFGESEFHRLAKKEIYEALVSCKSVSSLKLERFLDSVRPDISFYYDDIPVVVEMQKSAIHPDVIARRTSEYTRRGVYILWVSPFGETGIRDGLAYSMRDWERILHSIYGGTFYYWTEGETLLPVHFKNARTQESSHQFSLGMQISLVSEPVTITSLERFSLPLQLSGETFYREAKLWGIPEVWIDKEGQYIAISEAKGRYPSRFPNVRTFPPLEDPFHAEDIPSEASMRGFVQETILELQLLYQQFYEKYKWVDLKLIWVSIDATPNMTYFAPDWWQRFRLEYIVANAYRKEMLIEMLQEKLSGEKPRRLVKWP